MERARASKAAQSTATSSPQTPGLADDISPELRKRIEAIDSGTWWTSLQSSTWVRAMVRAMHNVAGLDDDAVVAALTAWSEADKAKRHQGLPARDRIWSGWSSDRDWLLARIGAAPVPSRPGVCKLSAPAPRKGAPSAAEQQAKLAVMMAKRAAERDAKLKLVGSGS